MAKAKSIEIIRTIVESMVFRFIGIDIEDNLDGTWTLSTCATYQLHENMQITIDSVLYTVVSVVDNESVKLKGASEPPLEFNIPAPKFFHGTVTQQNLEFSDITDARNKVPFVYLLETFRERENDDNNLIDRVLFGRLFFMTTADNAAWTTDQHYEKAINAMDNLKNGFVWVVNNRLNRSMDKIRERDIIRHPKFGVIGSLGTTKEKKVTQVFADELSGVELECDLGIKRNMDCSDFCLTEAIVCEPVLILDQDGDVFETVPSGGTFDITVFDTIEDDPDLNDESIVEDIVNQL